MSIDTIGHHSSEQPYSLAHLAHIWDYKPDTHQDHYPKTNGQACQDGIPTLHLLSDIRMQ